jgi:hypothetical protein
MRGRSHFRPFPVSSPHFSFLNPFTSPGYVPTTPFKSSTGDYSVRSGDLTRESSTQNASAPQFVRAICDWKVRYVSNRIYLTIVLQATVAGAFTRQNYYVSHSVGRHCL